MVILKTIFVKLLNKFVKLLNKFIKLLNKFVKLLNKFDFDLKFIFDNIKLNIIQK